jgi:hypothetical protein
MFFAVLVLAVFVVLLLAEISPEAVNALLILILLGLVLGRSEDTQKLIATISQAAGSGKQNGR